MRKGLTGSKPHLLNNFLAVKKKSPAPVSKLNLLILSFFASLIKMIYNFCAISFASKVITNSY